MPTIININLLFVACEYTSVSTERKDSSKKGNDPMYLLSLAIYLLSDLSFHTYKSAIDKKISLQ